MAGSSRLQRSSEPFSRRAFHPVAVLACREIYHLTPFCQFITVSPEIVEPVKDYLMEGNIYILLFTDETVVSVELPAAITMEVAEAPEGVKGDSANNVYKSATMTTGLVVQVPLFIKPGEKISVKTEDGSYLGRVN